jgi:hypothetical protein
MARILPFYRTGGLLSGGGGGGSSAPNGVVLGPFADWAALPVSADSGALASVTSIGAGNASGVAVWDGTEWQLYSGIFDTFSDMTAFAEPITVGAVVSVEASGDNNEDGVRYQYDGAAWARTAALTNGFAWALSSISNIDPSGVGATKAGDFGLLNGRLYRLTVPLALPGGGTQAYWVAPEVYAGSVTVGAYLVGTEVVSDAVALNLQGWPTVTRTNGTITSQSPRVRLATSGNNGSVLISALTANNVITPSTKVYIRFLMRAAVGNGTMTAVTNVGIPAFGDGSNYIVGAYLSSATSKGTFFWEGVGTSSTGFDRASQAAVAGLSSADDLVEVIINTTQGLRTCEMWRNGVLVSTTNVFASPFSDQVTLRAVSGSTAGAQTATLDISQVVVMTWA